MNRMIIRLDATQEHRKQLKSLFHRSCSGTYILLFIIFSLFLSPVLSAYQTDNNNSGTIKKNVYVGIVIVDILKIDDANQSITLDFIVRLRWDDPLLRGKVET